ncbi:hypothetical protein P4K71_05870 [Bacillus cereus]|uniref:Uncharacterized protein n=1 Tax=Bacillus cereus TaxID=1396 RepID=A0A9X0KDA2_BACCE|nr:MULTISPECIES: hypothetical protein [Bacillus]KMP13700.1 hypothetical protein TQ94_20830 [Bacillus cereus]MCR2009176.1 hypothetical protein [Bacillus cereus]MEB8740468.1 hypothetical protein [Bacillus cereus]MEB8906699.1 hypothetical protein [Bacillus cereus]MEB9922339.1 hypothetical protein [Bacillus cereus]
MDNPNKDKTCFIITPIGDDQSDIRRAADGVIDAVIIPALVYMGLDEDNIKVAHRMPSPGSINKQVITSVLECDLAIANLTNLNPNVMYELAIRHAARKPVIQICQKGTRLPFDITEERTIFYTNDMAGVIELNNNFKEMVAEAIGDEEPDNPIYRVIESNSIMKNVDETDPSRYMLNRIDSLENNLSDLINALNNNKYSRINDVKPKKPRNKYNFGIQIDGSIIAMEEVPELINKFYKKHPTIDCKVDMEVDISTGNAIVNVSTNTNLNLILVRNFFYEQNGITLYDNKTQNELSI